ncbi:hypothetical protein LCGC14_2748070 [marine sediment metagenome]|uniref:Uncharacterized protein n=1 Tax=marine sediment metagenome TaxID=412755 RepID=A0A0F8Z2R6_9ZZZZ
MVNLPDSDLDLDLVSPLLRRKIREAQAVIIVQEHGTDFQSAYRHDGGYVGHITRMLTNSQAKKLLGIRLAVHVVFNRDQRGRLTEVYRSPEFRTAVGTEAVADE